MLSLLPAFATDDIITPADTLNIQQYGYIYDTLESPSTSVPEPASTLGLLGLGAFGVGSLLKRKRKQTTLS